MRNLNIKQNSTSMFYYVLQTTFIPNKRQDTEPSDWSVASLIYIDETGPATSVQPYISSSFKTYG